MCGMTCQKSHRNCRKMLLTNTEKAALINGNKFQVSIFMNFGIINIKLFVVNNIITTQRLRMIHRSSRDYPHQQLPSHGLLCGGEFIRLVLQKAML